LVLRSGQIWVFIDYAYRDRVVGVFVRFFVRRFTAYLCKVSADIMVR
jgi:hypothetical protein